MVDDAALLGLVERFRALAGRRSSIPTASQPAAMRARQLLDHLETYVLPRARDLDAPLIVVLLGPTGAGKSTLFNSLAGRRASPTGVLRPTTREVVALLHPSDRSAIGAGGALGSIPAGALRPIEDPTLEPGLVLVDAPDVDSIEHANRALADRLAEAADLAIFVTTATRYADRVPWEVLGRMRDRGLPLLVVVNRMPPDATDRQAVLDDLGSLLRTHGIRLESDDARLVGVEEGALDERVEGLDRAAIAPVLDRLAGLRADREARRALAARALAGALAGLGPLAEAIADDLEHQAIDTDALLRVARARFDDALVDVRETLGRGTFLREETLRQWHAFVGADQITRFFASGIGRVRGFLAEMFRGPARAPVAVVSESTTGDIVALARLHAAEASRRTAAAWSEHPQAAPAIAADATLWSHAAGLDERVAARIDGWLASIATDVRASGQPKKLLARGASTGVNAVGVAVMVATFAHTGGLTGAEVGVAAGTAFLNQKLLTALFGEAAVVEMVRRARERLDTELRATFDEERARFEALVPPPADLRELAADLRAVAAEVRQTA